jgi:hypothetical protein
MSECSERCEEQFGQCIKHGDSMGGASCLAHRQYCLNGCAEEHFNDPPAPAPQEATCGQGPCPECGPQYSMSSPCALASNHSDYHSCSYGHSWY